ncbi:MAG: hypothetical protein GXC94_19325 [Comamonadaceae bacterium]|jgi:hypothetical protein|nr:hypothetical protein [Comamonadaceae bacterium]
MQFFSSPRHPWPSVKPPPTALPRPREAADACAPELCGWFDSSFDLAQGLQVVEQDDDALYQLWKLSLN